MITLLLVLALLAVFVARLAAGAQVFGKYQEVAVDFIFILSLIAFFVGGGQIHNAIGDHQESHFAVLGFAAAMFLLYHFGAKLGRLIRRVLLLRDLGRTAR